MIKIYTRGEALNETLKYFDGDELAANVWIDKYALRDNDDNLLENNPEQMHWRLAKEFARIEKDKFKTPLSEETIFECFDRFRYCIPQGSPMFGIGNDYQVVSLSNCYFLDTPLDSYADILRIDEQLIQISKRRGGVGICLDNLRPIGTPTKNAGKTSSGIIPFMERYSNSIREVGQQGRRGALILILNVKHPEIMNFIKVKNDKTKVTGANISVKITDEFMTAVKNNEDFELCWPLDSKNPTIKSKIKAREIWNELIKNSHEHAEPGILFWDTIEKETPSDVYAEYKSKGVNPCSELILGNLDSCRLMLMNLYSFVDNPFTNKSKFNYEKFEKYSRLCQRLMDDMVDLESEKIQKIIEKIESDPEPIHVKERELKLWKDILKICNDGRRTGTGTTGLGDTLAALGIKYGTKDSVEAIDKIFTAMKLSIYRESVEMAKELGTFVGWNKTLDSKSDFIKRIKKEDSQLYNDLLTYGRRNVGLMTCAPAGSVSLLTQTTSGVEPLFQTAYIRRKKITDKNTKADFVDAKGDRWQEFTIYHPKIKEWMKVTGESDIKKSPWYGCCAEDLDWKKRIETQSIMQKNICHSISSTVNLPNDVTVDKIKEIYEYAWEKGLKGITVYRKGCRDGVLITKDDNTEKDDKIVKTNAPKRPKTLPCDIYHIKITKKLDKIRHFDYMVLVGLWGDGSPYEIFCMENGQYKGKSIKGAITKETKGNYHLLMDDGTEIKNITKDTTENEDALTRMVSTALRHGVDIHFIVEQLGKVEGADLFAFSKSIARALKKYIKDGTTGETCEKCGLKLVFENGCFICKGCGNGKC
jgi:ribonucleoside-diphosphate reductase alpha chain